MKEESGPLKDEGGPLGAVGPLEDEGVRPEDEDGPLKDEGGRPEDEGGPADRLPSSLIPHPSSFPEAGTRPHENGRAQGSTSPARCPEGPGPALVRGEGAEGGAPEEPGAPARGDETLRNEPCAPVGGDPIARNEPCAPVGGDPIAPDEATGPAATSLRPGPLVGALALLALLLPVCAGHPAIVAAGSDVGRAVRPDTDRIGPDPFVGGGSVRRPAGSDRVGGRSPLRQQTGSDGAHRVTRLAEEQLAETPHWFPAHFAPLVARLSPIWT